MAKVDELVIELRAQTAQYERAIDSANKNTERFASVARRAQAAAAAYIGALGTRELIQYADTYKLLSGRLALITKDSEDLARTQEDLFKIAQDSRVGLESVVTLYSRLSRSTSQLGYSQQQLQKVTETLSKATVVSGATSEEASNALIQLSQGLASGALRGEEFNSVSEQLPVILELIEKQTGKTRGELRKMAADGQISAKLIVDSVTAAAGDIDTQFNKIPKTVSQALTQVDNAFLKYIGQSQAVAAGTGSLTSALTLLADNFEDVADAVGLVATVIASRYAVAVAAGAAQTIALRVAAVGTAGAMRGLGASMLAAFGGPVGLAVTALSAGVYYLATRTTEAEKVQETHNARMQEARRISGELTTATGKRREELEKESQALVNNAIKEIEATKAKIAAMRELNVATALSVGRAGLTPDAVNKGAIEDQIKIFNQQTQNLQKLRDSLSVPITSNAVATGVQEITREMKKAKKKSDDFQKSLDEMQRATSRDVYTHGMNELSKKLAEVDFQISDMARRYDQELTPAQKRQIDTIKDNVREHDRLEKELMAQERLMQDLGGAFSDAFEEGVLGAEDFGDALASLGKQIEKILFRQIVTNPLNDLVGGLVKGVGVGDIFSGIGAAIFGGGDDFIGPRLPGRATGGAVIAGNMYTVNEKKDQQEVFVPHVSGRIIPTTSGMGGGGTNVSINVVNNAGANVRTESTPNQSGGADIRIMIDEAVANNIATRGSKTSQALGAYNQQALVRR